MAKDKKPAQGKGKGKDKAKKGKADPPRSEWPLVSIAEHPRATRAIRRSKAWAGLLGLVLVGVLSWRAGVAPFEVGLRALVAGILLYVVVWAASVSLWQRIVLHEAKSEAERRRDEREALLAEQRARQQAGADEAAVA
jgi:hypothetical protein